eukprot:7384320-Prymnesium_polylepis.1
MSRADRCWQHLRRIMQRVEESAATVGSQEGAAHAMDPACRCGRISIRVTAVSRGRRIRPAAEEDGSHVLLDGVESEQLPVSSEELSHVEANPIERSGEVHRLLRLAHHPSRARRIGSR